MSELLTGFCVFLLLQGLPTSQQQVRVCPSRSVQLGFMNFQYSSLLVEHSGCLIKEWWKLWRFTSLCFLDWTNQSAEEFYIPSYSSVTIPSYSFCTLVMLHSYQNVQKRFFLSLRLFHVNFSTLPKKVKYFPREHQIDSLWNNAAISRRLGFRTLASNIRELLIGPTEWPTICY